MSECECGVCDAVRRRMHVRVICIQYTSKTVHVCRMMANHRVVPPESMFETIAYIKHSTKVFIMAQDVVKRRVVPPEAVAEMKERIEELQADIDDIGEEEQIERQLRIADMEQVRVWLCAVVCAQGCPKYMYICEDV